MKTTLIALVLFARWGEAGHRMIGAAAAAALPQEMPAFFRQAADQLSYLNPEPDRWRDRAERGLDPAMDDAFAPDHFIDMERVPPGALAAKDRFAYLDSLRVAGVEASGAGLLPFGILELSQRLREEFRLWRAATDARTRGWIEARAINDAGILGHFVADASNPHHTTIHFDGWVGDNPKGYTTAHGFHARFETIYVQTHFAPGDAALRIAEPARVFASLRPAILDYLRETHSHVTELYDLEQRAPFDSTTTDAAHRQFTAERLEAGARMLRDIWWTAWVTSGATPGAEPGDSVDAIIARVIAARGGLANMRALQSVKLKGLFLLSRRDTAAELIEYKLPNEMRMQLTEGGKTLLRVFDGRTGWQVAPGDTTPTRMSPDEQQNISHEADLLGPLVDYRAKGAAVALIGTEPVRGRDAYKLRVTLSDGAQHVYFIDRGTSLPVKWEGTVTHDGKPQTYESFFESYVDVGGVKFPSRIESGTKGGTAAPPVVILITSAVAVPAIAESRFAPPANLR